VSDNAAFLAALAARFGDKGLRVGTPPDPIATFPAKHPAIGDLKVWAPLRADTSLGAYVDLDVKLAIGSVLHDSFHSIDTHLPLDERLARVTRDVIRFLEMLFADQLLFWEDIGGSGARGWRECTRPESMEPLVLDNLRYRPYLWSGPRPVWQAVPAILARGQLRDDREYEQLAMQLRDDTLDGADWQLARRLVDEYEREHGS
jgi:hypothetical protein